MKTIDILTLANGRNPYPDRLSYSIITDCIALVWGHAIPAMFRDESATRQTVQQFRLAVRSVFNSGAITSTESALAQEVLADNPIL